MMQEGQSPLSRIKNLVPVSPAWIAKWKQNWKQGQSERDEAMRQALQRAQNMRNILLL